MRGAVRLAALMDLPVTTCGPTTPSAWARTPDPPAHQASVLLPCVPNFAVVRPADAAETAASGRPSSSSPARPPSSCARTCPTRHCGEGTAWPPPETWRGARPGRHRARPTAAASGSEGFRRLEAREALARRRHCRPRRVRALIWFEAQDPQYRDASAPSVRARVSVEEPASPVPLDRRRRPRGLHEALQRLRQATSSRSIASMPSTWHSREGTSGRSFVTL